MININTINLPKINYAVISQKTEACYEAFLKFLATIPGTVIETWFAAVIGATFLAWQILSFVLFQTPISTIDIMILSLQGGIIFLLAIKLALWFNQSS